MIGAPYSNPNGLVGICDQRPSVTLSIRDDSGDAGLGEAMLQLVRKGLHRASMHRCTVEYKRSGNRHISASGLIPFAAGSVVLLAALVSTGAYGLAAPPAALRGIPATTSQAVLINAPNASSMTAMIETWQRAGNGWRQILGPVPAHLGADGIGRASESTSRTPAGMFSLTQTFGRAANPGTRQPWFQASTNDWWVSDVRSPAYNTHQTCDPGKCPFNEKAGENLGRAGAVYDYAVVIDYNRWPAHPGAGSAFFLHVTNGRPTAGCVAADRAVVIAILRWLDPHQHPVISLGVR